MRDNVKHYKVGKISKFGHWPELVVSEAIGEDDRMVMFQFDKNSLSDIVSVSAQEAPALALAVLEAADCKGFFTARAIGLLVEHEEERKREKPQPVRVGAVAHKGEAEPDRDKVWRTARGAYVTGNPHNGEGWWICFSGLKSLDDPWGTRWEWPSVEGPWTEVTDPRVIHLIKASCYEPAPGEEQ